MRLEFGKDGKGDIQIREWSFADANQKALHDAAPPWEETATKKNARQVFTDDEVIALEAETAGTQYEPDTDAGPGFWQRIVDRIRKA